MERRIHLSTGIVLVAVAAALTVAAAAWLYAVRRRVRWRPSARSETPRGRLCLRDSGGTATAPVVLLLHGLAGSNRYFSGHFDALADHGYRVIAPDLLGFGRSPRPDDSPYDIRAHVDAVQAAVAETGAHGSLTVVGHSTGCVIALALALALPGRVGAVIGFGPAVYADEASARANLEAMGMMARMFLLDTARGQRLCQWMCDHRQQAGAIAPLLRPDLPTPIARDGVQHHWVSYSRTLREVIVNSGSLGWLERLDVPVHFVVGERDPVPDLPALQAAADALAHVTVERWPGDHDLPLTAPEACVALVRRVAEAG